MRLARGNRLLGFIVKVLVVTLVAIGFRTLLRLFGLLDHHHVLHGAAHAYLVQKPMAALIFAQPVLWVWFLVVPLFAAIRMYRVHDEKPQGYKSGPQ